MHNSSMMGMSYFRDTYLDKNKITKILDLGSLDINGCYRDILQEKLWLYHGADIEEGKNVDIILNEYYTWKEIKDEEYDVFISGQTFEHIEYPWLTIKEVARIVRPGGMICIIAPMICQEHKFPIDCWRFMPDGMWSLAKWAGLEVLEVLNGKSDDGSIIDTMLIARKPYVSNV